MGTFGGGQAEVLNPIISLAFALTGTDGTLPGQTNNDRPTIENLLKLRVQESEGWNSAHQSVFAGLPAGVPLVIGLLAKIAEQITGIDVTHWVDMWNDNPTVGAIGDIVQDVLGSIFTTAVNLQQIWGDLDFTDPDFNPEDAIAAFINLVLLPTGLIASWAQMFQKLTGQSGGGLNSLASLLGNGLFGPVTPGRMTLLPTGLIGDLSPNLLEDGDFKSEDFNGGGIFIRDTGVTYQGSNSARVVADGSGSKDMLSKNKLQVDKGQTFYLSMWVKWASGVATGTPIHLGITEYLGTEANGQPDIVMRAVSPATTDFVQLTGTYTVPASNVDGIRLRYGISPSATAGTFHFAKGELRPTRKMPTALIALLDDQLDDLFGGLDATLDSLLEKVGLDQFDELKDVLSGGLGGAIGQIQSRLEAFLNHGSTLNGSNIGLGDIADTFVGGVRNVINSIFFGGRNIDPSSGQEATRDDAYQTMVSLTDGMTSLAARVAGLETTYTSGITTGDDFERTSGSTLGAKWLVYTKGSGSHALGTPNGHDASVIVSGLGDREFLCIFNSAASEDHIRSQTPNQRILLPLAGSAGQFFGSVAANDVWLRISDDTTGWANVTGIQMRFWGDGHTEIIRWVAGNPTVLNANTPGDNTIPGPSHIIGGEAGTPGVGRYFKAILGSNGIIDVPEVGSASGYGAAFQRWGMGFKVDGHLLPLPGVEKPGAIRQWTAMDQ